MGYLSNPNKRRAFQGLSDYPEKLADLYIKLDGKRHYQKSQVVLTCLYMYYENLKTMPKFKGQISITRALLFELNPAMARGYFNADS